MCVSGPSGWPAPLRMPRVQRCSFKRIIGPRELFHEISICVKLWGMNTLTHFPTPVCLCGRACMHVRVSITPAAGSSAEPHPWLDRCVLSQYIFMEMALIGYDSRFIWTGGENALVFFYIYVGHQAERTCGLHFVGLAYLFFSFLWQSLKKWRLSSHIMWHTRMFLLTDILSVSLQISGVWGSSSSCWSVVSPPSRRLTTARRSLWSWTVNTQCLQTSPLHVESE